MVSTRQMATSNNGSSNNINNNNNGSGSNASCSSTHNTNAYESARLSVVTRQTSSNYVLVNCSTIPPSPTTQRNLSHQHAATSSSSSSSVVTRHHTASSHLTQAVKSHSIAGVEHDAEESNDSATTTSQLNLLDLPTEILGQILGYLGYKKVGQLRVVSPKMNDVCMALLNSTFSQLITQTYNRFHKIKSNMPRRESARRNHPLACECDIIETCYMRLSLLQMTFGKHIERGHCCFFPGAILDEVYTILDYIRNTPRLERPYRVTDELFDLSTMAMEYFRDRIEPTLPDIAYFNKDFFKLPTTTKRPALVITSDLSDNSSTLPSPPQSNMVLRKGIRKIKQGMKIYNNQLSVLRSELRTCKRKSAEQGKQMAEQQKLLAEQQKQTLEYANRLDENDKKNEEISRKFSTLLQELNKCKTELQYWRSKSPAIPTCISCGQKVAPILPPEDYQALINQGVKPEDIILNLSDDTDEFVFPDETTTAKVLALNTASRNLKRQHASNSNNNATTSNMNTSNGSGGSSVTNSTVIAAGNICDDNKCKMLKQSTLLANDKPTEMTNSLEYTKRGNIIRTTICMANATVQRQQQQEQQQQPQQMRDKDQSIVETGSGGDGCMGDDDNRCGGDGGGSSGYSTKLFYGSGSHKGVIVSPPSMLAKMQHTTASASAATTGSVISAFETHTAVAVEDNINSVAATTTTMAAAAQTQPQQTSQTEDVAALQAITSHETKKARRVQKATRCLNGSGKRSKQ